MLLCEVSEPASPRLRRSRACLRYEAPAETAAARSASAPYQPITEKLGLAAPLHAKQEKRFRAEIAETLLSMRIFSAISAALRDILALHGQECDACIS